MTADPLSRTLRLFSLQGRVERGEYLLTGAVLMLIKYLVELAVILSATGKVYSLVDFFSPLLASREKFVEAGATWLPMAWLLWTIPFVWIAVAMTLRRAADAGVTRWIALAMLVPLLNFAVMLTMAFLPGPSRDDAGDETDDLQAAWSPPTAPPPAQEYDRDRENSGAKAAAIGLAVGLTYTLAVMVVSVYGFGSYGSALFFGAPIVTGAASAYVYNRPVRRRLGRTLMHAMLVSVCCSAAFLLLGLEGVLCVMMAIPMLVPLMMLGAVVGRSIASGDPDQRERDDRGMLGCLLLLPLFASVEPHVFEPADLLVESSLTINAPPERVWEKVISFPEITAKPEWYFRLGIAAPLRAHIEGREIGAIRRCEFTTGSFVEPITAWDPPSRLAFDVTDQPEPMFELTPYRHLHPPHLRGSFLSTRGEFELTALPDGTTRLVGRTWYTLDLAPHGYWRLWTDEIVHRIHVRVLRHIQGVAERP